MATNAPIEIAESNRTTLELHVTPVEAYETWKADPGGVRPAGVPRFDPEGPSMPGRPPGCSGGPNPDFVDQVGEAVHALARAGSTRVHNVVTGFVLRTESAIAGIIFAVLLGTALVLLRVSVPEDA